MSARGLGCLGVTSLPGVRGGVEKIPSKVKGTNQTVRTSEEHSAQFYPQAGLPKIFQWSDQMDTLHTLPDPNFE